MVWQKFKKCVRYNDPWHAHALTFSCYHGHKLLASEKACQLLIEALDAARSRRQFDIWCYVFMPDHVHLVIWPRNETYDISRILFAIKRPMSYRAKQARIYAGGHFWQPGGGHDRNLWTTTAIHNEVDYIHANPVRRGLCGRPEDWRYSSDGFYAGLVDVPLQIDPTLPPRS